jgi:hypothetical protein
MTYQKIAQKYLRALGSSLQSALASGENTPELSFRPALDQFFRAVANEAAPSAAVIYEPRKQCTAGRPDWRFHDSETLGVYGYCEAKPVSLTDTIKARQHSSQIERYAKLGHPVILTDGLEFIFFGPDGHENARISLVAKPVSLKRLTKQPINPLLEARFRAFFQTPLARLCDEPTLVQQCAVRATNLAKSVKELASAPLDSGMTAQENKTIKALNELQDLLVNHQDANLRTATAFGDFVAQVLIFGLLYAHRVNALSTDTPAQRYTKLHRFWQDRAFSAHASRLNPFRALVRSLGDELEEASLGPLGTWYNDCRLLLSHVRLTNTQTAAPDYHTLFERFLTAYDPSTRFNYGAYYTPQEVSGFAVGLTQAIARRQCGISELLENGNRIIEPCCGTGSFIEQLLKRTKCTTPAPSITGLEILPGPYALAHFRMHMLGHPAYPTAVRILLTDTLADALSDPSETGETTNEFEKEQRAARLLSSPPLTLVIGNPPSVDPEHQGKRKIANQKHILKQVADWRPPAIDRRQRQNLQKQLNNDFVKFFRWACSRLPPDHNGFVCLVIPGSFLNKPTYIYARKWLLTFFEKISILELDADSRRGVGSANLFSTLQGRALIVAFRTPRTTAKKNANVSFATIADMKVPEKRDFLCKVRSDIQYVRVFTPVDITGPSACFKPQSNDSSDKYAAFWPLCESSATTAAGSQDSVFARSCSGVKLAPTALFTHTKQAVLKRKVAFIGNMANSVDQIYRDWFSGNPKPPPEKKLTQELRRHLSIAARNATDYRLFSYRPYVTIAVFINKSVLSYLSSAGTGGGTRARPEIIAAFSSPKTFGISVTPAPEDVGDDLHNFVSFCWNLPDNDLAKRGNGRVCCNTFPHYKKTRGTWDSKLKSNVHPYLAAHFSKTLAVSLEDAGNAVVFYTYAILCSSTYRRSFCGILKSGLHEAWPRIPIAADRKTLQSLTTLGKQLADLENPSTSVSIRTEFCNVITGMSNPFYLEKFHIDTRKGHILLFVESTTEPIIKIRNIPKNILEHHVSGYQPIQQWLKLRTKPFSRSHFEVSDLQELCELLERIGRHLGVLRRVETYVARLVSSKTVLFKHSDTKTT